jgi:2',3'-cyclic-nucleotide 2'-phosphodiesterase (5'-nucleotidase family)
MNKKNWYKWANLDSFNLWHKEVIQNLNLPRLGVNAETNEIDENAVGTTSYTQIYELAADDYRAIVETEIAKQFSNGIGELSVSPPGPEEEFEI